MGARKGGELDGAKGWCHTSGVVGLPFVGVTVIFARSFRSAGQSPGD